MSVGPAGGVASVRLPDFHALARMIVEDAGGSISLDDSKQLAPGVRLELAERTLRRPVRDYSRGMRQKIGIIQALQHAPELASLDERGGSRFCIKVPMRFLGVDDHGRHHQPRTARSQPAGYQVRDIAQPLDRLTDPFTRGSGDDLGIVEPARDGGGRNFGSGGHIIKRKGFGFIVHAAEPRMSGILCKQHQLFQGGGIG